MVSTRAALLLGHGKRRIDETRPLLVTPLGKLTDLTFIVRVDVVHFQNVVGILHTVDGLQLV